MVDILPQRPDEVIEDSNAWWKRPAFTPPFYPARDTRNRASESNMTVQECACRDRQIIQRIESVLRTDGSLACHADDLNIQINESVLVIGGSLPSASLKQSILPMVRRAGVLCQVSNQVSVA